MIHASSRFAFVASVALLAVAMCGQAMAGSTISTSISDSVATAVGSLSTSIKKSSQSASGEDTVAEGDYKVIDVATVAGRPGMVRLRLQAQADAGPEGEYHLTVPQQAVDAHGVVAGQVLSAQHRPYGVAFAAADTGRAFFLVLQDAWYHELSLRPIAL